MPPCAACNCHRQQQCGVHNAGAAVLHAGNTCAQGRLSFSCYLIGNRAEPSSSLRVILAEQYSLGAVSWSFPVVQKWQCPRHGPWLSATAAAAEPAAWPP